MSEISRMLVMTLRTVTFEAPCRCCACCTDVVDRRALQPQPLLEPAERRRRPRILVAQALGELRREQLGQRRRRSASRCPPRSADRASPDASSRSASASASARAARAHA